MLIIPFAVCYLTNSSPSLIAHCSIVSNSEAKRSRGVHLHEFNCKTPLISTELFKFSVIKINWPFHLQLLLLLLIPCTLEVITTNNSVSISHLLFFEIIFSSFIVKKFYFLSKVCKISTEADSTTEHFAMNNHHRIRCT